jgi:hypothetical protein
MRLIRFASSLAASGLITLSGCVQYPTEKQGVVDQRPQISFRSGSGSDAPPVDARVLVDGLDAGRVGDFLAGQGGLRVLPGTHVVSVVLDGRIVHEQRVYLADGVSRALDLP